MIRLFVTDVDGTLFPDGGQVLPEAYFDQIRKMKEEGILFGAASGRPVKNLREVFAPVADDIFYVAENGAYAAYQGEVLVLDAMTMEDSRDIVRDVRKMDGCMSMYDTGIKSYFEKGDEEAFRKMKDEFHFDCELVDDLLELPDPCIKFSVYRRTHIEEVTEKEFNPKWRKTHQVACGGDYFMDLMKKGVNKGTAVARIQEKLGITPEETLAFGDNINDLEMLGMAKYSFAIGNAREEVKGKARYVSDINRNNGELSVMKDLLAGIDDPEQALKRYLKKK